MKTSFKYEEIARSIESQIYQGALKPGQRLPSVREIRRERNVSPSTIFNAYYSLEAKGLIEARDRSGYYVSLHPIQQKKINQINSKKEPSVFPIGEPKNVQQMIDEVEETKLCKDFLILGTATPSLNMLPVEKLKKSVMEALHHSHPQLLSYEDPQGSKELRKHILVQVMKWGGNFRLNDIIITAGCLEAVNICLKILIKENESILVDPLNYFNISAVLAHMKLKIHTFPFSSGNFDPDSFESILKENKIKVCLISGNFHNPTGMSISEQDKKKIVDIASRNNVFIIEDDVFGDVYFGKNRPGTLKKYDEQGVVFYCSSFSKTLAPGYRIGYCIPGRFTSDFVRHKRLLSLGTNQITQAALVHFMETGRYDLHLKKLRKQLHLNLLQYGACILQHFPKEVHFQVPGGGYVLWIGFPSFIDGYKLFEMLKEEKIIIDPGEIFSVTGSHKNYIRLGFAEPFNAKIENSLKKIGSLAYKLLAK